MSKNDTPPKMPKMSDNWPKSTLCEIRAAWSGVFSIPGGTTGPGFKAENDMGGVRRRILITFLCFHFFSFIILSLFVFFDFHVFVTFSLFLVFLILLFFTFSWFLINFCCWHHFWSIFVSNLSACFMTHFISRKGALPLSPLLVVKLWPHFDV